MCHGQITCTKSSNTLKNSFKTPVVLVLSVVCLERAMREGTKCSGNLEEICLENVAQKQVLLMFLKCIGYTAVLR